MWEGEGIANLHFLPWGPYVGAPAERNLEMIVGQKNAKKKIRDSAKTLAVTFWVSGASD